MAECQHYDHELRFFLPMAAAMATYLTYTDDDADKRRTPGHNHPAAATASAASTQRANERGEEA